MLLGAAGGGLATARALFIQRAATAEDLVVEMLPQGARHGTPQRPSIRYTAADNVTRTLVSAVETWPPRFSAGDRVKVLYARGSAGAGLFALSVRFARRVPGLRAQRTLNR